MVVVVEVPATSHWVTASHDQLLVATQVIYKHAHHCRKNKVVLNEILSFIMT